MQMISKHTISHIFMCETIAINNVHLGIVNGDFFWMVHYKNPTSYPNNHPYNGFLRFHISSSNPSSSHNSKFYLYGFTTHKNGDNSGIPLKNHWGKRLERPRGAVEKRAAGGRRGFSRGAGGSAGSYFFFGVNLLLVDGFSLDNPIKKS